MSRYQIALAVGSLFVLLVAGTGVSYGQAPEKPNIILLMADDVGREARFLRGGPATLWG